MTHPYYQRREIAWLFGWHGAGAGGSYTGISEYIITRRWYKRPVNFFSVDHAGIIAAEIMPTYQTHDCIGFRMTKKDGITLDRLPVDNATGNYAGDPIVEFEKLYNLTDHYYPPELRPYRDKIWSTYVNEPNTYRGDNEPNEHDIEYLATGFLHLAKLSIRDNRRYACAGWAGGNPHHDFWHHPKTIEYLHLAEQYPHLLGVNWHLYSLKNNNLLANYDDMVGRYKYLYELCFGIGIAPPYIVAAETGWGEDAMSAPVEVAIAQMMQVQADMVANRFWGGLCMWTLGKWSDSSSIVNDMIKLSPANTKEVQNYQPVIVPAIDEEEPMDKPKIVIVKKPQKDSMTEAENETVSKWAWENYGRTTTHSIDDMLTMLEGGNDESYAVLWWADRQPGAEAALLDAGFSYIKMPDEPTSPQWTRLPIPHLSQNGPGADARANDCGAAAAAMVIRGMTPNSPTVDNIAIAYQTTPNAYMNFNHIDSALNGYGMDGTRRQPYTPEQISATVASGKPVIALVWYQSLPRKFSSFNGSHFIPIYGTDKNGRLLYRDPLAPTGFSEELIITYAQLANAMTAVTAEGNQPNQAMDCVKKNEPPPPGKTYNTADFMIPDPRVWLVLDRGPAGGEDVFTVFKNGREERVKNHQQKEVYVWWSGFPVRVLDTSPAPQSDGRKRMYKQTTNGQPGGQIAPAQCVEGVTYTFYSDVQYYAMDNCQPLSENSGANAPSTFKLIKRHEWYTFPNGFKVDVLWETIQTGEYQLYMEKGGVKCGWCGGGAKQANNNWSAIPKEMYINRAIPAPPPDGC